MRKKDNTLIWVSVTAYIRYDQNGNILWIDGILEDITAGYQLEELRWKAFGQIEKNMEQFAILNDQIRNPLSIILMCNSENITPYKELVENQVKNIDDIINKLDKGFLESEKVRAYLKKSEKE
jgi:hypothetical protein